MDLTRQLGSHSSRHASGDSSSSDDAVLVVSYDGDMVVMPKDGVSYFPEPVIKTEPVSVEFDANERMIDATERQNHVSEEAADHIKCEVKEEAENEEEDSYAGGRYQQWPTITEADLPPDIFDYWVGGLYRCKFCPHKVRSRRELLLHIERHIKNSSLRKCRHCDFITAMSQKLKEHEWKHTNTKPYRCRLCPYKSRVYVDFQRHQDKHNVDKPYACHRCNFRTKWRRGLNKHMEVHAEVQTKPHGCPHCDLAFKYKSALRTHLFRRHTDIKPLQCDQCPFRCKSNFELRSHKAKHGDIRPYPCTHPDCCMAFKTKSDCTKHMWIHRNETRYICQICGKGFKFKMGLRKHAVAHSEERNFECHQCLKKFKTLNTLQAHVTTHLEIKPFRCDVCFKTFSSRGNLLTHRQVHEGDRPFKCPMCVYGGRELEHLLVHIGGEHLGDFTYVCSICRKPFSRSMQLQIHLKTCHREQMADAEMELAYDPMYLDLDFEPEKHDISALQQLTASDSSVTALSLEKAPRRRNSSQGVAATETSSVTAAAAAAADDINEDSVNGEIDLSGMALSAALLVPPPVVQICRFGGLKFCMARKGSGFVFNHQKRGKKSKSWFMNPEYMSTNDAERHRVYLQKKGQGLEKVWRRKPRRQSYNLNERSEMKNAVSTSSVKREDGLVEPQSSQRKPCGKVKKAKRRRKSWQHIESDSDSEDEAADSFHLNGAVARRNKMERAAASAAAAAVAAVFEKERHSSEDRRADGQRVRKPVRKSLHITGESSSAEITPCTTLNSSESLAFAGSEDSPSDSMPETSCVSADVSLAGAVPSADSPHVPSCAAAEDLEVLPPRAKKAKHSRYSSAQEQHIMKTQQRRSGDNTSTQKMTKRDKIKHSGHQAVSKKQAVKERRTGFRCSEPSGLHQSILCSETNIKREPEEMEAWGQPLQEGMNKTKLASVIRSRETSFPCAKQSSKSCECELSDGNCLERERCLHVSLSDICSDNRLHEYLQSNAVYVGSLNIGTVRSVSGQHITRHQQRLRRRLVPGSKVEKRGKRHVGSITGNAKKPSRPHTPSQTQEGVGEMLRASATQVSRESELSTHRGRGRRKDRHPQKIMQSPPCSGATVNGGSVQNDDITADAGPSSMTIKREPLETDTSVNMSFADMAEEDVAVMPKGGATKAPHVSGFEKDEKECLRKESYHLNKHRNKGGKPRKLHSAKSLDPESISRTSDRSSEPELVQGQGSSSMDAGTGGNDRSHSASPSGCRKSERPQKIRPPITHPHSQIVLERLKQVMDGQTPSRKIPGISRLGILPQLQKSVTKTTIESTSESSVTFDRDQATPSSVRKGTTLSKPLTATVNAETADDMDSVSGSENISLHVRSTRHKSSSDVAKEFASTGLSLDILETIPPCSPVSSVAKAEKRQLTSSMGGVSSGVDFKTRTPELLPTPHVKQSQPSTPLPPLLTYDGQEAPDKAKEVVVSPVHALEKSKSQALPDSGHVAENSGADTSEPPFKTRTKHRLVCSLEKQRKSLGQKIDHVLQKLRMPSRSTPTESSGQLTYSVVSDLTKADTPVLKSSEHSRKRKTCSPHKRGQDVSSVPQVPSSGDFSDISIKANTSDKLLADNIVTPDKETEKSKQASKMNKALDDEMVASDLKGLGPDDTVASPFAAPRTKIKMKHPEITPTLTDVAATEASSSLPSGDITEPPKDTELTQRKKICRPESRAEVGERASGKEVELEHPKKLGRLLRKKLVGNNDVNGSRRYQSSSNRTETDSQSTTRCLTKIKGKQKETKESIASGSVLRRARESGVGKRKAASKKRNLKKVHKTQGQKKLTQASAVSKKVKTMLNKRKQNSAFKIVTPPKSVPKVKGRKGKGQATKPKKKYMYVELDLGLTPDQAPVKKRMGRPPGPKIIMDRSQANLCYSSFMPPVLVQENLEGGLPADVEDPSPPVLEPEVDNNIPVIDEIHPAEVTGGRRHRRSQRLKGNRDHRDNDLRLSPPVLQPETVVVHPSTSQAADAEAEGNDGSDVEFVHADYSGVDLSEQQLPLAGFLDAASEDAEQGAQGVAVPTGEKVAGEASAEEAESSVTKGDVTVVMKDDVDAVMKTDVDAMGSSRDIVTERDVDVMRDITSVETERDHDVMIDGMPAETEREADIMTDDANVVERDVDVMRESTQAETVRDVDAMTENAIVIEREIDEEGEGMRAETQSDVGRQTAVLRETDASNGACSAERDGDIDTTNNVRERNVDVMIESLKATSVPQISINVGSCSKEEGQEPVKDEAETVLSSETITTITAEESTPQVQASSSSLAVSEVQNAENTGSKEERLASKPQDNDGLSGTVSLEEPQHPQVPSLAETRDASSGDQGVVQEPSSTNEDAGQDGKSNSQDGLEDDHQDMDMVPVDSGLSSISSTEMSEGEVHQCERDLSPMSRHPQEEFGEDRAHKEQQHPGVVASDFVLPESEARGSDNFPDKSTKNSDRGCALDGLKGKTYESLPEKNTTEQNIGGLDSESIQIQEADKTDIQASSAFPVSTGFGPSLEPDVSKAEEALGKLVTNKFAASPANNLATSGNFESETIVDKVLSGSRDSHGEDKVTENPEQACNPCPRGTETEVVEGTETKTSFVISVVGDLEGEGKEVVVEELDNGVGAGDLSENTSMLLLEVVENFSAGNGDVGFETDAHPSKDVFLPAGSEEDGGLDKSSSSVDLAVTESVLVGERDQPPISPVHHNHPQLLAEKHMSATVDGTGSPYKCINQGVSDTVLEQESCQFSQVFTRQEYDVLAEHGLAKAELNDPGLYSTHDSNCNTDNLNLAATDFPSVTNLTWIKHKHQTASDGSMYGQKLEDTAQERPIMINIQAPSVNVYSNILHAPADMPMHSHASAFDPNSVLNFSQSCAVTTDSETLRTGVNFESDNAQDVFSEADSDFSNINSYGYMKGPYVHGHGHGFQNAFAASLAGVMPSVSQSTFTSSVPHSVFSEPPGQLGSISSMCSDSANIVWQACQQMLMGSSQPVPKHSDVMLAGQGVPPPYMESSGVSSTEVCFQLPQTYLGSDTPKTVKRNSSGFGTSQISTRPFSSGMNTGMPENRLMNESMTVSNDSFSMNMRPLFRVDSRDDSMSLSCPNESLGPFDNQYGDFSVPLCLEPDEDCVNSVSEALPDINSGSTDLQ